MKNKMNEQTVKRFFDKIEITESCWNWKASKRNKGYGAFVWADESGKIIQGRAHRFSYEYHIGKIPNKIFVLHKCDNPKCVNPSHLFLGTNKDNVTDMMKKGRHWNGQLSKPILEYKYKRATAHHNYKYDIKIILTIKKDRENGMSYGELNKKYLISVGYLFRICNNRVRKYG